MFLRDGIPTRLQPGDVIAWFPRAPHSHTIAFWRPSREKGLERLYFEKGERKEEDDHCFYQVGFIKNPDAFTCIAQLIASASGLSLGTNCTIPNTFQLFAAS